MGMALNRQLVSGACPRNGFTDVELGDKLGIDPDEWKEILKGKAVLDKHHLKKIQELTGLPMHQVYKNAEGDGIERRFNSKAILGALLDENITEENLRSKLNCDLSLFYDQIENERPVNLKTNNPDLRNLIEGIRRLTGLPDDQLFHQVYEISGKPVAVKKTEDPEDQEEEE